MKWRAVKHCLILKRIQRIFFSGEFFFSGSFSWSNSCFFSDLLEKWRVLQGALSTNNTDDDPDRLLTLPAAPRNMFANASGAAAKMFQCPKCKRNYMWKNTLMRHLRNECGKEPQFQCPFCPHRTKLKSNLTQHIRYKHIT